MIVAVFSENTDVIGQIDTVLDTSFIFEIEAVFSENICTIDTVLDASFSFEVVAAFDINHIVGVSYAFDATYQKALSVLLEQHLKYGKARFFCPYRQSKKRPGYNTETDCSSCKGKKRRNNFFFVHPYREIKAIEIIVCRKRYQPRRAYKLSN